MTKSTDIPRSKLTAHMPPGAGIPRSAGTFREAGPCSDGTTEPKDPKAGKRQPPSGGAGRGWTLVHPK